MGDFFNKDHATVMWGCKVVENLCQTDRKFREKYANYYALIENEIDRANNHDEEYAFGILLQSTSF
jgi:hypothetical protein